MATEKPAPALEQADKATQLAVDLIYLLEINGIDTELALNALKIVEKDFLNKREQENAKGDAE